MILYILYSYFDYRSFSKLENVTLYFHVFWTPTIPSPIAMRFITSCRNMWDALISKKTLSLQWQVVAYQTKTIFLETPFSYAERLKTLPSHQKKHGNRKKWTIFGSFLGSTASNSPSTKIAILDSFQIHHIRWTTSTSKRCFPKKNNN